jgi:hypothetical protein
MTTRVTWNLWGIPVLIEARELMSSALVSVRTSVDLAIVSLMPTDVPLFAGAQ